MGRPLMIQDTHTLALLLVAITALAFWLEDRFPAARKVGASLLVIVFGALLSNLGLVAAESAVYGLVTGPITSLAIVWLLLAVNLRDLRTAGAPMLLAFGLAVFATATGALVAFFTFGPALGEARAALAGTLTGTYSGGSLNFVAVGRALGLEGRLFTAAAAADNVLTAAWMGATLMLPVWLRRFYPHTAGPMEGDAATPDTPAQAPAFRPLDLLVLLTLGLGCIVASEAVVTVVPTLPSVVWLTTFALALGQVPAVRRLGSLSLPLGLLALHLFFAVIGIASRISEILAVGLEIFYFTAVVVLVHGLLVYGLGALLRLDVEVLSVASQAAVGGPSTAMALATTRQRHDLALPGLVVGLLGYAVGNYAGLLVAALLAGLG